MISLVIAACCILIGLVILLFLGDDDWPNDRHLDPPQGGTA